MKIKIKKKYSLKSALLVKKKKKKSTNKNHQNVC